MEAVMDKGMGEPGTAGGREAAIEELRTRLAETQHELDALTYAISHDLRAPLRTLYGFSTLLIKKHGDSLEGQPLDYLQRIISGAARLETMIEELLKLSRVGRAEMHLQTVDLSILVLTVIDELRAADPERKVEVEIEQGVACYGDPGMLRTVLYNLLQNSWKFTGATSFPRIRFFAREKSGQRRYCISDNGAGFAAGQADRLFKPFQRLHLESEFPGVGMGLALVKKIVQRHGGTVHAEGDEGAGATFCFTIAETAEMKTP
jgi:light-regulated signal transduction histidine kinase (bacteriophytochrome)